MNVLFSAAMTLMAEYRNKHDGLNLITAGGKKKHLNQYVIALYTIVSS